MLRLDDGRNVAVEGLVLLGRNPQPRVGEEDAKLIKVSDDTRTVSKSHLAVGVDVTGLYVMDRGSTNGTMVTAPDGGQRPCPPGDLVDVPGGSVISFGDHWLEVHRPGH
jgi:pSer/pThr/pTyr-binding forkhead associated (FHA) protein